MSFLSSSWTSAVMGGVLYLGVTGYLLRPANLATIASREQGAPTPHASGEAWEFFNPEVDALVAELKKEKAALQTREQQLNELASRLEAERAELTIVTQAVSRLQREFDRNVVRVKEQEMANLKKLAKVYANMDPSGAAPILKQMEDDQIVKILVYMKETETAPLLENFGRLGEPEAKRAATISERLQTSITPKPVSRP